MGEEKVYMLPSGIKVFGEPKFEWRQIDGEWQLVAIVKVKKVDPRKHAIITGIRPWDEREENDAQ